MIKYLRTTKSIENLTPVLDSTGIFYMKMERWPGTILSNLDYEDNPEVFDNPAINHEFADSIRIDVCVPEEAELAEFLSRGTLDQLQRSGYVSGLLPRGGYTPAEDVELRDTHLIEGGIIGVGSKKVYDAHTIPATERVKENFERIYVQANGCVQVERNALRNPNVAKALDAVVGILFDLNTVPGLYDQSQESQTLVD